VERGLGGCSMLESVNGKTVNAQAICAKSVPSV